MPAIMTDPDQIRRITSLWQFARDAYGAYGIHLSFPKNTDPRKTYQWRYLVGLLRDFDGWGFDTGLSKRFIGVAATYACEHKLLSKGLAIFRQANLMQALHDRLERDGELNDLALAELRSSRDWLVLQLGGAPRIRSLLARRSPGAYCNMVVWHQSGRLSDLFLALSQDCGRCMARLQARNPVERALLPGSAALFLRRSRLLKDPGLRVLARDIIGTDWRQTGV